MSGHSHGHEHEHEFEAAYGLPEELPAGERLLWQGAPDWRVLAREALHVRKLAVYFAVLLIWRGALVVADGGSAAQALLAALWLLPLAMLCVGMLALVAWLMGRTSVYTITNRRVVMRVGIVLTITFNLPYSRIESAGLRAGKDGIGDIVLTPAGSDKIAYVHLWPHARPWQVKRPEPMLRAVPDAPRVAMLLSEALAASAGLAPVRVDALSALPGRGHDAGAADPVAA